MNDCNPIPRTGWPDTSAAHRSEAFAEDLDTAAPPASRWRLLKRLFAALPLLCVLVPVGDAYMVH